MSLSPTHTETLFAIGAGHQVIAVDDQSNYPAEADAVMTDLSGYQPNVEAIAGYEPDLVVTSGDDTLTEQLEALGLTVWVGPSATTFDEAYAQIEQLGAATGHVAEAAELVGQMQTDLDALAADLPTSETPLGHLPRAQHRRLQRQLVHVHRPDLRAVRAAQHRRRRRGRRAATRSSTPRRSSRPTPT